VLIFTALAALRLQVQQTGYFSTMLHQSLLATAVLATVFIAGTLAKNSSLDYFVAMLPLGCCLPAYLKAGGVEEARMFC
jgi:hypothetical protein